MRSKRPCERMSANIAARVTLIARDGTVLADSAEDPARMANQAVQPEVARALNAGVGISTRRSGTAGEELIYVAVPVIAGESVQGVARVAAPAAQVQDSVNRSITVIALIGIAGTVFAVLIGYGVASRTSRSIGALTEGARQLTAGELDYRVQAQGRDETQELAQAFNRMAVSLRNLVRDLSVERGKLTAVLNTMADGVVVIDGSGRIVLVNHAAEESLNLTGGDVLDRRFTEIIRDHNLQQLVGPLHGAARGTARGGGDTAVAAVSERDHHSLGRTRRFKRIADDARPDAHSPGGNNQKRICEQRLP